MTFPSQLYLLHLKTRVVDKISLSRNIHFAFRARKKQFCEISYSKKLPNFAKYCKICLTKLIFWQGKIIFLHFNTTKKITFMSKSINSCKYPDSFFGNGSDDPDPCQNFPDHWEEGSIKYDLFRDHPTKNSLLVMCFNIPGFPWQSIWGLIWKFHARREP
jgi:hypothetical protein